jgi:quinol monooxygenase YgiN
MVRMMVAVKVKPEKRDEFLDTMRCLRTDRERGEHAGTLRLYRDIEYADAFSLIDEWETDEELADYLAGESFGVFQGALTTLCDEAEIRYGLLCEDGCRIGGIASLSAVRSRRPAEADKGFVDRLGMPDAGPLR